MHREDAVIPVDGMRRSDEPAPRFTSLLQDRREQLLPQDDAFLSQVDDEALEYALKIVAWHPKDVSQFLRATAIR